MKFFFLAPRGDFASYTTIQINGKHYEYDRFLHEEQHHNLVEEYLGDPPVRPRRRGHFHAGSFVYFVHAKTIDLFLNAARNKLRLCPTTIRGRENEEFFQVWVDNVLDCLDLERTEASAPVNRGDKIGIVLRPEFILSKWDGSGLFAIPEEKRKAIFVTEEFVFKWKESRFKGAEFKSSYFDPNPIRC